tara:strand:+ start:206 stop:376 length:171 start_codon:yes stop_codon:yes gene_type:complete
MKTYEVTTTETLTKTFRLEANSEEEAWEIDLYGEGVLLIDMETESEEVEEVNEVKD